MLIKLNFIEKSELSASLTQAIIRDKLQQLKHMQDMSLVKGLLF